MPYTAQDWPIAAAMLPFPRVDAEGNDAQEADAARWQAAFREVAEAGFREVDLTDSWLRPGDLAPARLDELAAAAASVGIRTSALSVIRQSVIDAASWEQNLAYSHRSLDAAARLGCEVVSFGLHQALTPAQREVLWFWVVEGHRDPVDDRETWDLAVSRLRELGRHAVEVGLLMSLEMYEDTYLGTAESSVRLVEDIDLPNVGLNPDLGNLIRLHRPVEPWRELVAKTLPYANFWHVKNYARDEDPAAGLYTAVPAPMETGLIDYRWAVKVAIASGFQGIITTEHYGGDGLSVSAANQEYLRGRILPRTPDYELGRSRVAQGRQAPVAGAPR
jgi:sugar phosphate isomerase/epimerase